MLITAMEFDSSNGKELDSYAEDCVRIFSKEPKQLMPGEAISFNEVIELQLQDAGQKAFELYIDKPSTIGLFTQHTAEEFNIKIITRDEDVVVSAVVERTWVAQHEHDDEVGSIAIEKDGDVDQEKLNKWLSKVLGEKGIDIFRMKGFLSISGDSRRFVFQGVHMLFDAKPDRSWDDMPRRNQLVFIGRNLDEDEMRKGFEECLV